MTRQNVLELFSEMSVTEIQLQGFSFSKLREPDMYSPDVARRVSNTR